MQIQYGAEAKLRPSNCILAKFIDEQYTTINQSTAGRFDLRVFVNCLQVKVDKVDKDPRVETSCS